MIKINLLHYRSERKKELILQQIIIGVVPLIMALIIVAIFWVSINAGISGVNTEIVLVKQEIEKSKVALKEIAAYKNKKETLTKKMQVIANLQQGKDGPVHVLDELAVCIPGSLWLTSIQQKGMAMEITGNSFDNIAISNYMINLEKSNYFETVDLKEVKTDTKGSGKKGIALKKFTITCNVKYTDDKKAG